MTTFHITITNSTKKRLMEKPTHVYVGKLACGCAVAVACDHGDRATADAVHEFIMDGYTVERVPFGSPEHYEYVDNLGCNCEKRGQLSLFEDTAGARSGMASNGEAGEGRSS